MSRLARPPRHTVELRDLHIAIGAILLEGRGISLEEAMRDAAMGELSSAIAAAVDIVFDEPIMLSGANGSVELRGTLKGKGPPPACVWERGFIAERADFRFRAIGSVVSGHLTSVLLVEFAPGDWGDEPQPADHTEASGFDRELLPPAWATPLVAALIFGLMCLFAILANLWRAGLF